MKINRCRALSVSLFLFVYFLYWDQKPRAILCLRARIQMRICFINFNKTPDKFTYCCLLNQNGISGNTLVTAAILMNCNQHILFLF